MSSVRFWVVDVFTNTPYKGNPLAIVDNTAGVLSEDHMRLITRQFNLSETTFFSKPTKPSAVAKLRSFLPDGREVFGAGHNILGAWWFLADSGLVDLSDEAIGKISPEKTVTYQLYQELGGHISPLTICKTGSNTFVQLRQAAPQAHSMHPDHIGLAASIGLETEHIGLTTYGVHRNSVALLPQVMSTATTYHLLVPVSSIDALSQVSVQRDKLLSQLSKVDRRAYGLFLFTRIGRHKFQARFFSPGMPSEDPATGSAAGPLAAYLYNQGLLDLTCDGVEIEVHQGQFVGRDCVIHVLLERDQNDMLRVDLLGKGVNISQGSMVLPSD